LKTNEFILGQKAQPFIHGPAERRGVESHGLDASIFEILHGVINQASGNPLMPRRLVYQDHGDPCDGTKNTGGRRGHRLAIQFSDKATIGLQCEKAPPIGLDLVPPSLFLETHTERYVINRHSPDLNHALPLLR